MYYLFYRQIKYTIASGIIFEFNTNQADYFFDSKAMQYLIYTDETKFEVEGSLYRFQFQLDSTSIDKYKRFYPKIPSLLANVSAVFKLVTVLGKMIIQLLCQVNFLSIYLIILLQILTKLVLQIKILIRTLQN